MQPAASIAQRRSVTDAWSDSPTPREIGSMSYQLFVSGYLMGPFQGCFGEWCAAVSWASPRTFIWFYCLDVMVPSLVDSLVWVHHSCVLAHGEGMWCQPSRINVLWTSELLPQWDTEQGLKENVWLLGSLIPEWGVSHHCLACMCWGYVKEIHTLVCAQPVQFRSLVCPVIDVISFSNIKYFSKMLNIHV